LNLQKKLICKKHSSDLPVDYREANKGDFVFWISDQSRRFPFNTNVFGFIDKKE
jgi:hypothetical protein